MPNPHPVPSSTIRSIAYDHESRSLELEFTSGAIYRYLEVPAAICTDLKQAESKGRYFNAHIKGHYPFERLPGS